MDIPRWFPIPLLPMKHRGLFRERHMSELWFWLLDKEYPALEFFFFLVFIFFVFTREDVWLHLFVSSTSDLMVLWKFSFVLWRLIVEACRGGFCGLLLMGIFTVGCDLWNHPSPPQTYWSGVHGFCFSEFSGLLNCKSRWLRSHNRKQLYKRFKGVF